MANKATAARCPVHQEAAGRGNAGMSGRLHGNVARAVEGEVQPRHEVSPQAEARHPGVHVVRMTKKEMWPSLEVMELGILLAIFNSSHFYQTWQHLYLGNC